MPSSYKQDYRKIYNTGAKVWAEDADGGEGYIEGSDLLVNSDCLLTASATAANNFTVGKVGFLAAAGTVTLADSDAEASTAGLLVMALGTIAGGETGKFQMPIGTKVTVTGHGFTVGAPLFISGTAGALTATEPGTGKFSRPVAVALDANTLYFLAGGLTVVAK